MPRVTLNGQGAIAVGDPDLLVGVTDLEVAFTNGNPVLYAAARGGGSLSRFSLGDGDDVASLSASWSIPSAWLQIESTDIALINAGGTATNVMLAGLAEDDLRGQIDSGTGFSGSVRYDVGAFDLGQISNIAMSSDGISAFASLRSGGLVQLEFALSGQVSVSTPSGLGSLGSDRASDVSWISAPGGEYAVVTYAGSDQITLFRADGNGRMVLTDTVTPAEGAWADSPVAVETLVGADGIPYAVMAASGSSSLTVFAIDGNDLVPLDHVIDTRDTRFNDVSHVEVMQIAGQPYVVAAGSDQGLTVMALLPGGQLLEVATVAASLETPLNGISAIEVMVTGDTARIFVATQAAPYLVEFNFNLDNAGLTMVGDAGDNSLIGTGADDMIAGGMGDDTVNGGAGDDMIADGSGTDRLTGGAGSDVFVLGADGEIDRILDFQRGTDSILMRAPLPGLGDSDIEIFGRSWGAELRIGTEIAYVYSSDGRTLTRSDFDETSLQLSENISTRLSDYPDGSPDIGPETGSDLAPTLRYAKPSFEVTVIEEPSISRSSSYTWGSSSQNDVPRIIGQNGNDLIEGDIGDDVLIGAGGFDTIIGGVGNDAISGGLNADELVGGTGNDVITGERGADLIYGDGGDDFIWGGEGTDQIRGGGGNDYLDAGFNSGRRKEEVYGGDGNDTILGGGGFDRLIGGSGDDLIDGGRNADLIFGDDGGDTINGEHGTDRILGGAGEDLIYGGEGSDALLGQAGNDLMWGGEGNDRFRGGRANDYIDGEDGNDILRGNLGFDTLIGGHGDDTLIGGLNADRFVFADDHGHDRVIGFNTNNQREVLDFTDLSTFTITSDVFVQAVQMGEDVVITTGVDSSITLAEVDIADLDGTDFIF